MSAPLAGKFLDHYEILGVDSKASAAVIRSAYEDLARKYSPTNAATGNKEKFTEVNLAYEVLGDPHMRKAFDGVRNVGSEEDDISFPVQDFLDDLDAAAGKRICLMSLLYHRRKANTISPGISLRQVESVMKVNAEELGFMMWMLKQQGLVISDDKSRLLITVAGIEYLEANRPTASAIQPWLRAHTAELAAAAPAVAVVAEPVSAPAVELANLASATSATQTTPAPTREMPVLTGQGMATAGLSSLRSALQKSIGPLATPQPAQTVSDKAAAGK